MINADVIRHAVCLCGLGLGLMLSGITHAVDLPLVNGRYPEGRTSVFALTEKQKQIITCLRTRIDGLNKSPYLFRLSPGQTAQLRREAGYSPRRFELLETYLGNDKTLSNWNIVIRFSGDQIEVPHRLLLPEKQANRAEVERFGLDPEIAVQKICRTSPRD